jgi:acyl carrier protein
MAENPRARILARLGALLAERLGLALDGELGETTGLLGQGIGLDSVEVLQLVSAIEEAWSLTIEDDDLKREHFATLGTVVTFVQDRLPA